MTDIERKKIIDKIISAPGELTPEEINAIKADRQLSELYREMCLTAAALFSAPELDREEVEQEFKRFASERLRRRSFGPLSLRQVAAAASIVILAGLAVGAGITIHRKTITENENATGNDTVPALVANTSVPEIYGDTATAKELPMPGQGLEVFENQRLDSILTRIAAIHACRVEYLPEANRELRLYFKWEKDEALEDVVEMLNTFDQINLTLHDNIITVK